MTIKTDPISGITYNWDLGSSTYKAEMDANLRQIGITMNASVISKLSADPGSPSDGDAYIVDPTGTGAFSGQDNNIAVYELATTTWLFFTPSKGMTCFLQSGLQLIAFDGSTWSTNAFTFTF